MPRAVVTQCRAIVLNIGILNILQCVLLNAGSGKYVAHVTLKRHRGDATICG